MIKDCIDAAFRGILAGRDETKTIEVLFRGGPMDGKRIQVKVLSTFIAIPIGPIGGPYDQIRYRQAELIGDGDLFIYELDDTVHH